MGPNALEAGGILLGYRRGDHLHVSCATTPQVGDIRSRYAFQRQAQSHQKIARELWASEGMIVDYIGEWHTHPEQKPTPSHVDTDAWRRVCANRLTPLIFLIVGNTDVLWVGAGAGPAIAGGNIRLRCGARFDNVLSQA
ncbi:Mov34/MPN/PAD-1 family protein [Pandoraea sputorum]|uniref:Mov34/MPN/PAD-1 family protein n=1 Tax=Pandoraea sputorum TaxID=93222 RepID=UPI002AF6AD24|nr:Mov34/MPN/PAD-1 family protein [Pandoraea sputorum]